MEERVPGGHGATLAHRLAANFPNFPNFPGIRFAGKFESSPIPHDP
jgi:hypothetical protein